VTSGLRRFEIPEFRRFVTSGLHRFETPEFRGFEIPDLLRINYPESSFHEFHQTRHFEGDRFFMNSPTSTRNFERIATHHPMQIVIFTFLEFELPSKNFSLV
jgi:hypothetical protein